VGGNIAKLIIKYTVSGLWISTTLNSQ